MDLPRLICDLVRFTRAETPFNAPPLNYLLFRDATTLSEPYPLKVEDVVEL